MKTTQKVISLLTLREYVSGQEIADSLGISREAVLKAIKSLRGQGYEIESRKNRGYRLMFEDPKPPGAERIEDRVGRFGKPSMMSKQDLRDEVEFYKRAYFAVLSENNWYKELHRECGCNSCDKMSRQKIKRPMKKIEIFIKESTDEADPEECIRDEQQLDT